MVLFSIGIGYAYLNTTLSIEGTTDIDSASWNVYFDNVVVLDSSVSGDQVTQEPTIDADKTTVSFHINLKQPGDFYGFTVDVVNDGSIDAMIDSVSKLVNGSETLPSYLNYEVAYDDIVAIEENQLLAAGDTETINVFVEYRTDIDASDLPDTADSLDLSFSINYVQADENAVIVSHPTPFLIDHYCYSVSTTRFYIGSAIPNGQSNYLHASEAMEAFGAPIYIQHTYSGLTSKIIQTSSVGFVIQDKYYILKGAIDESDLSEKPVYEENKGKADVAFGSENCQEENDEYNCSYYEDGESLNVQIKPSGSISAIYNDRKCCIVDDDGSSKCDLATNIHG